MLHRLRSLLAILILLTAILAACFVPVAYAESLAVTAYVPNTPYNTPANKPPMQQAKIYKEKPVDYHASDIFIAGATNLVNRLWRALGEAFRRSPFACCSLLALLLLLITLLLISLDRDRKKELIYDAPVVAAAGGGYDDYVIDWFTPSPRRLLDLREPARAVKKPAPKKQAAKPAAKPAPKKATPKKAAPKKTEPKKPAPKKPAPKKPAPKKKPKDK